MNSFVPLDVVVALSNILSKENSKFDHIEIERHLLSIGNKKGTRRIRHPRFPISLQNPSIAAVVGHILHDGYLSKEFRPVYYGREPENISHFKENVQEMFNCKIEFSEKVVNGYPRVTCPTVLGYLLAFLGIPRGNKVKNDVFPPPWLITCGEKSIRAYLRAFIADEANIMKRRRGGYIRVKLASNDTTRPSKLLLANWGLFKMIEIAPSRIRFVSSRKTKKGEIRASWEFFIRSKRNLEIFNEKIGFIQKTKQAKLDEILRNYYYSEHVFLRDGFRRSFFNNAFHLMGGINKYRKWLELKLGRRVHFASIRNWVTGRHSAPLDVIGATAMLLNSRELKCSLIDLCSNIMHYTPSHNAKVPVSLQMLSYDLESLGFKVP